MYSNLNPTYVEYVVKKDDSLYSIAKKFKTTIAELTDVNMLTNTTIYPNQILMVPHNNNSNDYVDKYTIKEGDTFESISNKLNVDIISLGEVNDFGKVVLKEGYVINIPLKDNTYIIKENDTISSILKNTNRTLEELFDLNITPNMRIKI